MIRNNLCIMIVAVILLFSGFSTATAQEDGDNLYLIFELMKVDNEQETAYAETEAFWKKIHQERVDAGELGSWGLYRCISPIGSETIASHITMNMYEGWEHAMSGTFNPADSFSEEMLVNAGLQTRDMKWVYMIELEEMVR